MSAVKFTLTICTIAGFWQPPSWTSFFKHIIYKTYAMFLIFSLYIFTISQFINIVLNVDNSDELTDSLYMMLTVFVAGYKQVYMWVHHKNITMIIDVLTKEPFKPCESYEIIIQQKFEKKIRNNTLRYLTLVGTAVIAVVLSSVFLDFMNGNLTYKAWVPFDYSTPATFTLVYSSQIIGMSTSGLVNVACDSLVCGLLLHMCCQFEILEYRLKKITQNQSILCDCIRHHNRIFEYAHSVNNMFAKIIAFQFAVSMLVVCSNLYRLAMSSDYIQFIPLMLYTGCMLMQIFIYCWFGNEVKLKSLRLENSVYDLDWLGLNDICKKNLLIIMRRATIPIEFSSVHVFTLNLESFVALLNMSYSAFNLLLHTQK